MTARRRLGPCLRIGAHRVAAIEEVSVTASAQARPAPRLRGWGGVSPVAILIDGPDGLTACTPDGAALSPDAVEAALPGALAAFRAAATMN